MPPPGQPGPHGANRRRRRAAASGRPKPRPGAETAGRRPAPAAQPPGQPPPVQPGDQRPDARSRPPGANWTKRTRPRRHPGPDPARHPRPGHVRLDAEVKQIHHAIRMAAYNAETSLARALDGHYARSGDEAYAVIREALAVSGDIQPATANCSSGSTRYRTRPPRPCRALRPAHRRRRPLSRHQPHPPLPGQTAPKPCIKDLPMSESWAWQPNVRRWRAHGLNFPHCAACPGCDADFRMAGRLDGGALRG